MNQKPKSIIGRPQASGGQGRRELVETGTFAGLRGLKANIDSACRECCRFVLGFCFLLLVTSRMSFCPSKKSHLFSIQFCVWIVTLRDPVVYRWSSTAAKLLVPLDGPTPLSVGSSPGDVGTLLQFNHFP